MLFIDGAACGILEAKREGAELGHVDAQSKRYATSSTRDIPAKRGRIHFSANVSGPFLLQRRRGFGG